MTKSHQGPAGAICRASPFTRRYFLRGILGLGISLTLRGLVYAGDRQRDLVGGISYHKADSEDTFAALARRFGLGYTELVAANPQVDPWLPAQGSGILLPRSHLLPSAPRRGIVINLAQQRLFYFPGASDDLVFTFPIGIGRDGNETRLGSTHVVHKRKDPVWIPPPSVRKDRPDLPAAVGPGPLNPLGRYALGLGWEYYVIHGTNRPYSIGRRVSYGCIRLYPEDIEFLYARISIGTAVHVVDQPVLTGWADGVLYLEVHPTQRQADELAVSGHLSPESPGDIILKVADAAGNYLDRVDWSQVEEIARQRSGVPIPLLWT